MISSGHEEDQITFRLCALASGSSGNATLVATDRTALLVDCGAAARDVEARLRSIDHPPERLDGILITHAHWDHYRSAGTLHARFGLPVYVDPGTAVVLRRRGGNTSWKRIEKTLAIPEAIGDLGIEAIDTPHGEWGRIGRTVAYRLACGSKSVAVVTDLGTVNSSLATRIRGVDALVLEANYDEATIRRKLADSSFAADWEYLEWVLGGRGHLSNRQCGEALIEILRGPGAHVFPGHVSENHKIRRLDNNSYAQIERTLGQAFGAAGLPLPHLHRTYRIGRDPGRPSDLVEI